MTKRLKVYVRPLRRRWRITQRELAFLIGLQSGGVISRIEGEKRSPSLAGLLACEILFGASPRELFPGLFNELEDTVLRRATDLFEELQGNPSKETRAKLDFLESVLARLESRRSEV
jgi:transcriptional regulator with XRE-family HTH domain